MTIVEVVKVGALSAAIAGGGYVSHVQLDAYGQRTATAQIHDHEFQGNCDRPYDTPLRGELEATYKSSGIGAQVTGVALRSCSGTAPERGTFVSVLVADPAGDYELLMPLDKVAADSVPLKITVETVNAAGREQFDPDLMIELPVHEERVCRGIGGMRRCNYPGTLEPEVSPVSNVEAIGMRYLVYAGITSFSLLGVGVTAASISSSRRARRPRW